MNDWMASWQQRFPSEWCGIKVEPENRIAPVCLPTGVVIDFRHQSPKYADVPKREAYFGRMAWVFDAVEAREHRRLVLHRDGEGRERWFRWDEPRRAVALCRCPVFLDLGLGWLFEVREMAWGQKSTQRHWGGRPLVGNGVLVSADEFVTRALKSCEEQP